MIGERLMCIRLKLLFICFDCGLWRLREPVAGRNLLYYCTGFLLGNVL